MTIRQTIEQRQSQYSQHRPDAYCRHHIIKRLPIKFPHQTAFIRPVGFPDPDGFGPQERSGNKEIDEINTSYQQNNKSRQYEYHHQILVAVDDIVKFKPLVEINLPQRLQPELKIQLFEHRQGLPDHLRHALLYFRQEQGICNFKIGHESVRLPVLMGLRPIAGKRSHNMRLQMGIVRHIFHQSHDSKVFTVHPDNLSHRIFTGKITVSGIFIYHQPIRRRETCIRITDFQSKREKRKERRVCQ